MLLVLFQKQDDMAGHMLIVILRCLLRENGVASAVSGIAVADFGNSKLE
ncbi:hypothetical protein C823_003600 [Eubacterium plexicaudatum ASF492]|uniref:Uncharacterized protein n=1 Tax=Eubacterium plexicaudatum ASF492 TaxID=1235802 RepID=N1ZVW9_9FIRM|nr:hypothetical protein C823_003600 [Eubacterium plexicaudatum ASF492]